MSNRKAGFVAAVAVVTLCATASATHPATPAAWAQAQKSPAPDRRAQALLARAAEALGGTAALNAVNSLLLVRHDHTTVKILFPDRWQTVDDAGALGTAIFTLDGDHAWNRLPERLAAMSKGAPPTADALRSARRHEIVQCSLKYLLRPPSDYIMRSEYAGQVTFGPVTGETVEFTGSDGFWVSMIFDSSSGLPTAQITRIRGDPQVHGTHLIEELRDYRRSGGILVPFQSAEYRLKLGKTEPLAVWRFTIEVNPPLKKSDFREPPGQ